MIDRTTKVMLLIIAAGIWLHLFTVLGTSTTAIEASLTNIRMDLIRIETVLAGMRRDVSYAYSDVNSIAFGQCQNGRIC